MLAFAGDGDTHGIRIQALNGATERQGEFIYICYDNEGYMNTGYQCSSFIPLGAISGTTPILGKRQKSWPNPASVASLMLSVLRL